MKDPAILFYYDKWITATAEMDADTKAWYLELLIHQYDKKNLPNTLEELASLARVKFSQYSRFEQVFEQVLKHKFKQNENGRLENDFVNDILRKRELFLSKRSDAGKISVFIKFARTKYKDEDFIEWLKDNIEIEKISTNDKQVFEQVLKQMNQLYINVNVNIKELKEKFNNFINWMNLEMKKNFKFDKTAFGQFSARAKDGYNNEHYKKALSEIKKDKYHIDTNFKYITPEFLTRSAQLEKWFNSETKSEAEKKIPVFVKKAK